MYEPEVIDAAEDLAETIAIDDRMQYQSFIEAGEHFAAANDLIVSDPSALVEQDEKISINSFQYKFYSKHAPTHARALGDIMWKLAPDGLGHYTTVITKVASYVLIVSVNGRDLFTITALPIYRGVHSADILLTHECQARFAKDDNGNPLKLSCIGPEIGLISIYATLCNPAQASSWVDSLLLEAKLRAKIPMSDAKSHRVSDKRNRQLLKFIAGSGRVLIGAAAIAALVDKRQPGDERFQIISITPLEHEAKTISEIMESDDLVWKIDDLKIPSDNRIQRLSVHLAVDGRREAIIDVYNSANFDLIPYTLVDIDGNQIRVGTPFVLMRYRLIDMWTIQILIKMGAIDGQFAKKVLADMQHNFDAIAAYYTKLGDIEKILPLKAYIGKLEDPELALKRASQAAAKYYSPYLPAASTSAALVPSLSSSAAWNAEVAE